MAKTGLDSVMPCNSHYVIMESENEFQANSENECEF